MSCNSRRLFLYSNLWHNLSGQENKMICIPNLQWYLNQSVSRGITPRCPFATVTRCPCFYQSLSLLGEAGSTAIPEKEDKKLQRKWEKSTLWPVTAEQETSISGHQGNYKHFGNFCPEVSYERFGLFASHLNEYADETDLGLAHSHLSKERAATDDWRWNWASIHPHHYSECLLYSVLSSAKQGKQDKPEDIVTLNPNVYGIGINIKALCRKVKSWF